MPARALTGQRNSAIHWNVAGQQKLRVWPERTRNPFVTRRALSPIACRCHGRRATQRCVAAASNPTTDGAKRRHGLKYERRGQHVSGVHRGDAAPFVTNLRGGPLKNRNPECMRRLSQTFSAARRADRPTLRRNPFAVRRSANICDGGGQPRCATQRQAATVVTTRIVGGVAMEAALPNEC